MIDLRTRWPAIRAWLADAWQFVTVKFGAFLIVAPEALAFIRENVGELDPILPDVLQPRLLQAIGVLIVFLRLRRMMVKA